jgi:serine/threonine protein kinase
MLASSKFVETVVSGNTYTIDPRYDLTGSRIVGKGSFGVVCTAFDTIRQMTLAIKRIRPFANDEWDAKHTLREIRLMKLLGEHPNVQPLFYVVSVEYLFVHSPYSFLYLIM